MRSDVLAALNDARAARRAAILITDIADGVEALGDRLRASRKAEDHGLSEHDAERAAEP